MLIDGRKISGEIVEKLHRVAKVFSPTPVLGIVIVGNDPVVESFVRIKKRIGESIGVSIVEFRYPDTVTGEALCAEVKRIVTSATLDGMIIQLPLPRHIDAQTILDAVPPDLDVDALSRESVAQFRKGELPVLPPVAGAVQEILERNGVDVAGKEVLVLGHGRLVGIPVAILLRHNHAHVTVIDKPVADMGEHVRESMLVICGVGKPGLILPEMLTRDTIVIDAGTSESGGKIIGDADPRCAEVARLITPVPGGVGPIAVAMLFKNLLTLAERRHNS